MPITQQVFSRQLVPVAPVSELMRLVGFALSGGGAKGSFQVGALKYLMRGKGIRPSILTCTSVGAVNGLKLAEGERAPTPGSTQMHGLDGLEQIWLSLQDPSDMYAPAEALAELGADAYNALDVLTQVLKDNAINDATAMLAKASPYLFFFGPLGLAYLDTAPLADLAKKLVSLANNENSLFTLTPIANLLESGALDRGLLMNSGIALAMSTVELTSGALRYIRLAAGIDRSGRPVGYLVDRDELTEPVKHALDVTNPIDVKDAMLASAAAPLFFAPQRLKRRGDVVGHLYTDGGVRELTPVQAALDLGARRVFAIDCNAPPYAAGTNWPHTPVTEPSGLFSLGLRVLADMLEEIDYDDTVAPPPEQARFWHIRPDYEVEGDTEIDAGAIRINMDYGYMCAFDAVDGAVRSAPRRALLQRLSERIAVLRRDISDRERCEQWAVKAIEYAKSHDERDPTLEELVKTLDYHRYRNDQDIEGRAANLASDLVLCGSQVEPGNHISLSVGLGQAADNDLDLDLSRKNWPSASSGLSARTAALGILQAMKCQLKPLYDARLALAGPTAVPPDPNNRAQPDQPWLRWEQSFSTQQFFGDPWPGGFEAAYALHAPALDDATALEVTARQVERKGTSGWAIAADGFDADHMPIDVQLLVPGGAQFRHLTGSFEPTSGAPWSPPPGAVWKSTWGDMPGTPAILGAQVTFVTTCWVTENDYVSLQAIARIAGSAGDTLAELSYDPPSGWSIVGPVIADGAPLIGVTGNPIILQATFAQEESFELLVPLGSRVAHFHRSGRSGAWLSRGTGTAYAAGASQAGGKSSSQYTPVSLACIQSNYGTPANLEAVVGVAASAGKPASALIALRYDAEHEQWIEIGPIKAFVGAGVSFSNFTGDPTLFQSNFGHQGDFELLVPQGQRVLHLYRDNDNDMVWKGRGSGVLYDGSPISGGIFRPPTLRPTPVAVACWQTICASTPGSLDFHALLRTRSPFKGGGDSFTAMRFDAHAQQWHVVDVVSVNGKPITI